MPVLGAAVSVPQPVLSPPSPPGETTACWIPLLQHEREHNAKEIEAMLALPLHRTGMDCLGDIPAEAADAAEPGRDPWLCAAPPLAGCFRPLSCGCREGGLSATSGSSNLEDDALRILSKMLHGHQSGENSRHNVALCMFQTSVTEYMRLGGFREGWRRTPARLQRPVHLTAKMTRAGRHRQGRCLGGYLLS